jgi:UDPglucose 6-dehydrogenase
MDNRIGSKILQAGPGFSGSCFQGNARASQNCAGLGRSSQNPGGGQLVNDTRKRAMARKVAAIRRKCARQDHGCAWPNIQAEHR